MSNRRVERKAGQGRRHREPPLTQADLDRARSGNLGHRMIALANDFTSRILVQYGQQGYGAIRPVHGAVLRNLEMDGTRLTALAGRAGITHRAMAKIVDDVAALGFVARCPDPLDRRASLVRYTPRGIRLLEDSSRIIEQIYADYSADCGPETLEQLEDRLHGFLVRQAIEISSSGQQALHSTRPEHRRSRSGAYLSHNLGRYLQLAGDDYHRRCTALMAERGHRDIRFDHLAVLSHLDLDGMTLSDLAASAAISLQAMGKQVRPVQLMGYVTITVDPDDRRVRRVRFTTRGLDFLADLLASFRALEGDYAERVGPGRLRSLQASLARVIDALGLQVPARDLRRS